jgi:hypothetical protein
LHSRGENPPRSRVYVLIYIILALFSGSSHEIVYYKKNVRRPFLELADDGETAQWKWQKSMQPHFVVCVRSAIPNFRRKSLDFIRRGCLLKAPELFNTPVCVCEMALTSGRVIWKLVTHTHTVRTTAACTVYFSYF